MPGIVLRATTKAFHSHKSLVELALLLPHAMEAGEQCTERLSKLPKVTQLLSSRVTFVSQQSGCGLTLSQPICQQADSEVRGQPIQGLCAGLWGSQAGQLHLRPPAITVTPGAKWVPPMEHREVAFPTHKTRFLHLPLNEQFVPERKAAQGNPILGKQPLVLPVRGDGGSRSRAAPSTQTTDHNVNTSQRELS